MNCKWIFHTAVLGGSLFPMSIAWAQGCQSVSANASLQLTAQEQVIYSKPCQAQAIPFPDAGQNPAQKITPLAEMQRDDQGFWDNWSGYNESPVLSSNTQSAYYGVGVWLPDKYKDVDVLTIEDAQQWIRNHGLQMSLGVGGEDGRSARFRLDYRWHEENLDDLFLQVEIPFQ